MKPESAEAVEDFEKWYDATHIPEMLSVDGFFKARRFESAEGGTFVAIYEFDADVDTARANLKARQQSGQMSPPVGVALDPPPTMRYFRLVTDSD
jgi:hypothetical protein